MNALQMKMLGDVVNAFLEVIESGGSAGVPEGALYALMMEKGFGLPEFNDFVGAFTQTGLVTKSGHLLRLTDAGRARIQRKVVA